MTTHTIENEEEASTGLGFYTVLMMGIFVAPAVMLMLLQLPVNYIQISDAETVIQMLARIALMGVYSVMATVTTLTYFLALFSKNDRVHLSNLIYFFVPGHTDWKSDLMLLLGTAITTTFFFVLPTIFLYRVANGY